jgi:outer membrane biosynthesis protein TonB
LLITNGWSLRKRIPPFSAPNFGIAFVGWAGLGLALLIALSLSVAAQQANSPSSPPKTAVQPTAKPSSAPTPTATPKPTPTPTPTPAPTPTPSPSPVPIAVTFLNQPSAYPGQYATLNVRTAPNTSCNIEVDYMSGPSTAQGLVPKTSNGSGYVSWTWKVGTRTTPGQWPISVTCGDAQAQTYINVI